MDTVEAIATIMALWPKSFTPTDRWRPMLVDELEGWSHDERALVLGKLKASHNGRKITMDTLKKLKGERSGSAPTADGKINHKLVDGWLADVGLLDAFKRAHPSDRVMVSRLVYSVMQTMGWQDKLERCAGAASDFAEWERVENLAEAAERAWITTTNGRGRKLCYPHEAGGWTVPNHGGEIILRFIPHRIDREADRAGVAKILAIAEKHGGLKSGNYGLIFHDPDYQQYSLDYTMRTGRKPG